MAKPTWIVGIDEVGRGPLAGPLYLCACAMPLEVYRKIQWHKSGIKLTDSKKMTPQNRKIWYDRARILEKEGSLKISTASLSALRIDGDGLGPCIKKCIEKVLQQLDLNPTHCQVLLDGGLRAPDRYVVQRTIIKGDQKKKIISLAAVIAKVTRDQVMVREHKKYPNYYWHENKGYGTRAHRAGISQFGLTPLHRKSFISRTLDKTVQ